MRRSGEQKKRQEDKGEPALQYCSTSADAALWAEKQEKGLEHEQEQHHLQWLEQEREQKL